MQQDIGEDRLARVRTSAADERPEAAGEERRWVRLGLVAQSLLVYLVLVWLFMRDLGERPGLAALALLAGFPLAALIARYLDRGRTSRFVGTWGVIGLAVGGALTAPLLCLDYSQSSRAHSPEIEIPADAVSQAALAKADLFDPSEGLRLRIRGLSFVPAMAQAGPAVPEDAEIILVTAVEKGLAGDALLIKVRLIDAADGGVIWSRQYRGDPSDLTSVRRLVIRALTEAMSLTREGIARGQLV